MLVAGPREHDSMSIEHKLASGSPQRSPFLSACAPMLPASMVSDYVNCKVLMKIDRVLWPTRLRPSLSSPRQLFDCCFSRWSRVFRPWRLGRPLRPRRRPRLRSPDPRRPPLRSPARFAYCDLRVNNHFTRLRFLLPEEAGRRGPVRLPDAPQLHRRHEQPASVRVREEAKVAVAQEEVPRCEVSSACWRQPSPPAKGGAH